ncbi:hypothetical protein [Streptacidiphilus rugosus]|uniref:hypothetical protein n=1 Tax=Streptacidiphilus rugosus TaxID=405783 RepID=UPI00055D66A6|nr:hypothetical protein [Streptacidiphilus rugosus]
MAKTHYGTTPRGGYMVIFFTERETEAIAEDATTVGSIAAAFIPEPHTAAVVTGMSLVLKWKAKSALRRDKCLSVQVAGLVAIPRAYKPGVDDIPPTPQGNWS